MLAFFAIFSASLCGYAQVQILAWPIAAVALASTSWATHYALIRRGVDDGLSDVVHDTLVRSLLNAVVATGAAYWVGVGFRLLAAN